MQKYSRPSQQSFNIVWRSFFTPKDKLYATHQPTNCFQKTILTIGGAIGALVNPERGDLVATLGDTTSNLVLPILKRRMYSHPDGKRILQDRPAIRFNEEELAKLATLPANTLGNTYYRWMSSYEFDPTERPTVRYIDSDEDAYIIQRYREAHDMFHVILGLEPTVLHELALKWFEFLQTGLPVTLLSSAVGPIRLSMEERRKFYLELVPWATKSALQAEFLMNIYYEELLEHDITALQQKYKIYPYKQ